MEDSRRWLVHEATPPNGSSPDFELLKNLFRREYAYRDGAVENDEFGSQSSETLSRMEKIRLTILEQKCQLGIDPISSFERSPTE